MIDAEQIIFSNLTEEQYQEIYPEIKKAKYVSFSKSQVIGIFYQGYLLGIFSLVPFIDNSLSITLLIKEECRGNGLAKIVCDKIVEVYGRLNPNVKQFIYNVDWSNESSIRAAEKFGWTKNHDYDEMMEAEGAEFFQIYQKDNSTYRK